MGAWQRDLSLFSSLLKRGSQGGRQNLTTVHCRRPSLEMLCQRRISFSVDTDGSGGISFEEFSGWWSERQLATQGTLNKETMAEVNRIWAESDRDGSGDLDADEFGAVLAKV